MFIIEKLIIDEEFCEDGGCDEKKTHIFADTSAVDFTDFVLA